MRGAGPTATMGPSMGPTVVVVVMVTRQGRPKQHGTDIALQNIERGAVGVGGCQEHLRRGGRGTGDSRDRERWREKAKGVGKRR